MHHDFLILYFLITNDVEHLNVLICQLSTFFSELYILFICLLTFQLDYFGFGCSLSKILALSQIYEFQSFLPFCSLSFHFVNRIFPRAKEKNFFFHFDEGQFISIYF